MRKPDRLRNPRFHVGDVVVHVKTCQEYIILIDCSEGRLEETNEPAYAYRQFGRNGFPNDTRVWFRSADKMEDGRFVKTKE